MKQVYYNEWGRKKIRVDWLNPGHYLCRLATVNAIKKLKNVVHICEIGCGVGILANWLGKSGYKVDGYDIDKEAIRLASTRKIENFSLFNKARRNSKGISCVPEKPKVFLRIFHTLLTIKKSKNTTFIAKDVLKLKTKKKYDVVISNSMLEHVKDDVQALKNMADILRDGGYLVLSVPINMKYWTKFDKKVGHYRRYTKKELKEKAEKAGFSVIYSEYLGYPIFKWFYFNVYLKEAKKRESIVKKKKLPIKYYGLLLLRPLVYFDFLFNSPKAINIIMVARKR